MRWLQDKNVILSRQAHGIHHKKPHDNNYCIVSGHMNVADKYGFFSWLQRIVEKRTGHVSRAVSKLTFEEIEERDKEIKAMARLSANS